jgi:hypothetical protein
VIYIVRRTGSPAIGAWIVDPHLLVYRQTQAADYPQFIVENKPIVALACAPVVGSAAMVRHTLVVGL